MSHPQRISEVRGGGFGNRDDNAARGRLYDVGSLQRQNRTFLI